MENNEEFKEIDLAPDIDEKVLSEEDLKDVIIEDETIEGKDIEKLIEEE